MPELRYAAIFLLSALAPLSSAKDPLDRLIAGGMERAAEGRTAQVRIDDIATQSQGLVQDYRQLTRIIDGLKVYNTLLQRQIDTQHKELNELQQADAEIALVERQIVPMTLKMIDALEDFINLDVPFLQAERRARVMALRALLERADASPAEKLRRVLEAYQVEIEYGHTIETYKGQVEVGTQLHEVDFLRIGRIALLYQSSDRTQTGSWDRKSGAWIQLKEERYRRETARGLRMARKQVAPDLLVLPIPAAESSSP